MRNGSEIETKWEKDKQWRECHFVEKMKNAKMQIIKKKEGNK